MKKLGFVLIGLVVLLLAAIFIIPSLVPSEVYKDKIQTQLSQELGRDVRINGEVTLATFPVVKAKTGPIEIDNPEGFTKKEFVSLEGLEARVKLFPLLSKRVEISKFTLEQPRIHLERRADGRANWELSDAPKPEPTEEAAPFARDGSLLTAFEPAINAFTLQNGLITYVDAISGQNIEVADINTAVSLPGLSSAFNVDGDFVYDGTPITLDMNLNSPRAFLDGKEAAIKGTVKTNFADLKIDGNFLASEALDIAANIDGNVTDMAALKPFLGENAKYIDPLNSTKIKGDIRFVDGAIVAKNADVAVRGDSLSLDFKGDVDLTDAPIVNGTLEANLTDLSIIEPFLEEPIKGLDSIETVNIKADMSAADKGFIAKTLTAKMVGPGLDVAFNGQAAYETDATASGRATVNVQNPAKLAADFAPDVAAARVLGATQFSGDITYAGENITAKNTSLKTSSEYITANFNGDFAKNGEAINVNGSFDSNIPDVPRLVQTAEIEVKDVNAIKAARASGQVQTDGKTTRLTGLDAALTGGAVNGTYKGDATIGETQSFNGAFSADIPNMAALDQAVSTEIPYAAAIGQVTASGQVKGAVPANAIELTGLNAKLSGGQMTGSYIGSARYKDGLTMSGRLETNIPNLRAVAQTAGTELPPNPAGTQIFGPFSLSGDVSGTPEAMSLSGVNVSLDQIQGTGKFGVDLTKTRPALSGDLSLNGLDLRPYMESYSSQAPTGGIQPWSTDPIDLAALKSVDVNFTLNTPNVKTGRINLDQTTLRTNLNNGLLTVDVPTVNLYGGTGTFKTVLDGRSVPSIDMNFNLKRVASNDLLDAVAGFTQISGQADTKVSFKGQGRSQDAIMKSLSGGGNFDMRNGGISGIDVAEFLSGIETAISSRSLPSGIGAGKSTTFTDLDVGFAMNNGVAQVQKFGITGPQFLIEGEGQVDIGNQLIDFRLLPKPTGSRATGIAKHGIPLKFSGPFGSAKAGLDTDFFSKIIAAEAKEKAAELLREQLGGQLGGVLGGEGGASGVLGSVLGGSNSGESTSAGSVLGSVLGGSSSGTSSNSNGLGGALGGLLGGGSTQPAQSGTQAPQPSTEDAITGALGGLFGKKKKKK